MVTKDITLYWLSRLYGWGLPMPELRICNGGWKGFSCYASPKYSGSSITIGEGIETVIPPHGIIIIDTKSQTDPTGRASAIAHEWRHHMQYFSGIDMSSEMAMSVVSKFGNDRSKYFYKAFYSIPEELDALEFECKTIGWEVAKNVLKIVKMK